MGKGEGGGGPPLPGDEAWAPLPQGLTALAVTKAPDKAPFEEEPGGPGVRPLETLAHGCQQDGEAAEGGIEVDAKCEGAE